MNRIFKQALYFFSFLFLSMPLFAQVALPSGMQSLADGVLGIFRSQFVTVILAIFLCGAAVAYAFNKDNEKIKRNAIAVGIAAAILVVAQTVVDTISTAARAN